MKVLTFLISATSLGILAVFDRLCETGFVGKQRVRNLRLEIVWLDFWQQIIFVRPLRGGGTHGPLNTLATILVVAEASDCGW